MLGIAIADLSSPNREAMAAIQKQLEENEGKVALSKSGAVILLEENEIAIGSEAIHFGGNRFAYDSVKHSGLNICKDKNSKGVTLDLFEEGDISMITISSHKEGMKTIRKNLSEAVDVFGQQAYKNRTSFVLNSNHSMTCENLKPKGVLINQYGLAVDENRIISWDQIRAIDTTQSVTVALKDRRIFTISST